MAKQDLNMSYENTPIVVSPARLKAIQALPNVESVNAFATKAGIINVNNEVEGVVLKGIDSAYSQSYLNTMLVKGDSIDFKAENGADGQILVSKYIANRLSLDVGDDFIMYFVQESIRRRKFVIKGIYNTGSEDLDKVYVLGSLDLIRRLNKLAPDEVGGYEVRLKDFQLLEQSTLQIEEELPIDIKAKSIKELVPEVFQWLEMLDMNATIIFVLMSVVAVINLISALLITILERTNMIGILKALGFHNSGVKRVFLFNALYVILLGLGIGNLLGLSLYFLQDYTHLLKLDEETYYMAYVPVKLFWTDVVLVNAAIVFIALLALFIPSSLITKISPIKAIQFK